jgi:hypothetical protein
VKSGYRKLRSECELGVVSYDIGCGCGTPADVLPSKIENQKPKMRVPYPDWCWKWAIRNQAFIRENQWLPVFLFRLFRQRLKVLPTDHRPPSLSLSSVPRITYTAQLDSYTHLVPSWCKGVVSSRPIVSSLTTLCFVLRRARCACAGFWDFYAFRGSLWEVWEKQGERGAMGYPWVTYWVSKPDNSHLYNGLADEPWVRQGRGGTPTQSLPNR